LLVLERSFPGDLSILNQKKFNAPGEEVNMFKKILSQKRR